MAATAPFESMQRSIWQARLPLEIRLAPSECRIFDKADAYLVSSNVSVSCNDSKTKARLDCMAPGLLLAFASSPTACILQSLLHS